MQTKLIKYIESKYPGYTARPGMEHQAYALETRKSGLTDYDLKQLREQGLILVKTAKEIMQHDETLSQEEKDFIEFMRIKYNQDIPAETIEETSEIIIARNNIHNPLAFLLHNCECFFRQKLRFDTVYRFRVENHPVDNANFLIITYNGKKLTLNHKISELLLQQVSPGEHDFVFRLNEAKEIGLRIDSVDFIRPEPSATPSQS
ncbi:hypothetical protein NO1_1419 [Candidatus Termititenax aidoneus]|uniref:Uncharacterized protein n=1 Tax=Termititenax aidoneus TaxID=2218524 RepID=A0A388TBQ2_TERA1|nr:hypothetical protein NO1_1419 [Candidatus Termititenax aidoneus]